MLNKIWPLIILSAFALVFFLRLFYPQTSIFMIPDFGESDVLHLNIPFKYILSQSLQNHEWPLWTPYLANGFPLLAEGQIGTFYLPNLLLFRFLPVITAYNLNLVLSFVLSSFGMYLFCRRLKLSKMASFIASFVFTFSGFMSVHLNHYNLIQAVSLLPLIFWSAYLLWQKPKFIYVVFFAFILSQQIFTGHFYIVFITFVGLILFLTLYSLLSTKPTSRGILSFLLSIILGFGLSAIQLLPTVELWQLSSRQGGLDFDTVTDYPYPIKHLLTFINPYAFGNPADGSYPAFNSNWGIFWENTAYIGIIPLILALISIIFFKKISVRIFFIMLFASLLLVLGKYSPLYFVFTFPPFNLFRVPSKFLLLTVFSLSILSSITIDELFKKIKFQKAAICGFFLIISVLVLDEYKFSYNYPPVSPAKWWMDAPKMAQKIGQNKRVITIGAPNLWNEIFMSKGWKDLNLYRNFKDSLYPDYNALFNIKQMDINTGGLVPRRLSFVNALSRNIAIDDDSNQASVSASIANLLNLFSVNYLISLYEINNSNFELTDTDPIHLYRNKYVLPRSYIISNSKKQETLEDFSVFLSTNSFVENPLVLVENDELIMNSPSKEIKEVKIISENSGEIRLEADVKSAAILVLTDTNYPGWNAYIDGHKTKIYDVNLTQRGVLIPTGKHQIKFSFQSNSFDAGKTITIFSLLIIFPAVFLSSLTFPRKGFDKKLP